MKHKASKIVLTIIGGLVVSCTVAVERTGIDPHHNKTALAITAAATKKDGIEKQEEMEKVSSTISSLDLGLIGASLAQPFSPPEAPPTSPRERKQINSNLDLEPSVASLAQPFSPPEAPPTSPRERTQIISNPASRPERDEATRLAGVVTTALDERTDEMNPPTKETTLDFSERNADILISRAGRIGREALAERNLKKGRHAMQLLRQATMVAPDYRRGWEVYSKSLVNLQARFGHSLVMRDSEINSERRRCDRALSRLR